MTFDVWLGQPADIGSTVDWSIVGSPTMQAATLDASGTAAALTDAPLAAFQPNGDGEFVHSETFSLPNIQLGPGVYYLALQNFTALNTNTSAVDSGPAYWDENDGPSTAWQNAVGYLAPGIANGCDVTSGYCSETFEVNGTATPEPNSTVLVGAIFLVLAAAAALRKRIQAR